MSIQGSVNQLLGITGILAGIMKKQTNSEISPNPQNISKNTEPKSTPSKRIVLNPYIKAEQALKTDGNNKIMQKQMQEKRRKDKGDI